jgi:hypothetical protein
MSETHRDRAVRLLREELVGDVPSGERLEQFVDALIAAAREPYKTAHEEAVDKVRNPSGRQL